MSGLKFFFWGKGMYQSLKLFLYEIYDQIKNNTSNENKYRIFIKLKSILWDKNLFK